MYSLLWRGLAVVGVTACLGLVVGCTTAPDVKVEPPDIKNAKAKAPGGRNAIALQLKSEGELGIVVQRKSIVSRELKLEDVTLVRVRDMSLILADGRVLGKEPRIKSITKTPVNKWFNASVYKKSTVEMQGEFTRVEFEGGYAITLAAFEDGVAYRWETSLPGEINIVSESADLDVFHNSEGFFSYGNGEYKGDPMQNSWETPHSFSKVEDLNPNKLVLLPMYLQTPFGVVVVSETDLWDYPGLNYVRSNDRKGLTTRQAKLPAEEELEKGRYLRVTKRQDIIAKTKGTRTFPWRTFTIAKEPIDLLNADLNYKLAAPCTMEDTSWIKPGIVAWDWWNNWNLTDVDFKAGCNTKTYINFIDFAASNKIPYVILDAGWSKREDVLSLNPEVDLQALFKYAEEKKVGLILWCTYAQLLNREDQILGHYAKMGAKGFKIDYFERDDQTVLQAMERIAQAGAKHKLLLDYHGIFKPVGHQRKYPHILTIEGVFGLEQAKWNGKVDFARNDTILPFTRMVAGPMDYTPGAMGNQTLEQFKPNYNAPTAQGTRVHQMALMMMFESPLQMMCDSPSKYRANPECTDFMAKIPTVWDETIGLEGKPGEYLVMARRKGDAWYIAGINNWDTERSCGIELKRFLQDWNWTCEAFADGNVALGRKEAGTDRSKASTDPSDWKRETDIRNLLHSSMGVAVHMAPGGGWIGRFERKK